MDHENILKIYNCYFLKNEESFALILEYLEGGDLRQYMKDLDKPYIEEQKA